MSQFIMYSSEKKFTQGDAIVENVDTSDSFFKQIIDLHFPSYNNFKLIKKVGGEADGLVQDLWDEVFHGRKISENTLSVIIKNLIDTETPFIAWYSNYFNDLDPIDNLQDFLKPFKDEKNQTPEIHVKYIPNFKSKF